MIDNQGTTCQTSPHGRLGVSITHAVIQYFSEDETAAVIRDEASKDTRTDIEVEERGYKRVLPTRVTSLADVRERRQERQAAVARLVAAVQRILMYSHRGQAGLWYELREALRPFEVSDVPKP